MPRGFSEQEKTNIKNSLWEACKQSWTRYGYKKTSVDELCRQVGISKGAFYLFFESKEALFCEVLCGVQEEICDAAIKAMEERRDKQGAAEALKVIYREYDRNNFLYGASSGDYAILMNKLSHEQRQKIERISCKSRKIFSEQPYLKLKVDESMAVSVIYSLIMNIRNKDIFLENHREIFDFMVDHLIDSLYE
ncbi:MAG: TetR/AcrR family transcriptional regulator [Lachnospiraceae bacterium]|jgi:hypothetical protein|nr:TetR/AcrR family transcriptional regulator [Lachnospiraceae bacterium]